jgi:hypothetical protein
MQLMVVGCSSPIRDQRVDEDGAPRNHPEKGQSQSASISNSAFDPDVKGYLEVL